MNKKKPKYDECDKQCQMFGLHLVKVAKFVGINFGSTNVVVFGNAPQKRVIKSPVIRMPTIWV